MKFESKKGTKVAPLTANQVVPLGANQVAPLRRKWNGSIAVQINIIDKNQLTGHKINIAATINSPFGSKI